MSDLAAANDALIRAFVSAWERRDSAAILEAFSENAVYHAMPLTPIEGKDELRTWVEQFESVAPGRLEVQHQVAGEGALSTSASTPSHSTESQ